MKVQKIKLNSYDYTWLVLDNNHLPIKPITEFIRYLNNVDKSPCTIRSYAYHLKLFWEFLIEKQINWIEINLASLAALVGWLRNHNKDDRIIDLVEDHSYRREHVKQMVILEVAPRKIRRYLLDWSAWWVRTTMTWTKQDLLTRLRITCWDVTIGHIIQAVVRDYINSDQGLWDLQERVRVTGVGGLAAA